MSKPQTGMNNKYDRIVVLIDMDCFYCQVEEQLNPALRGKPIAVVQYNAWRGGGIIAVNYPAREKGVTRHMRGDEAKEHCPEIELVKVPNIREKADLSRYRRGGKEVAAVLQTFTQLLTRASVDEAYLDITDLVQNRLVEMNQGKFALQPNSLKNTFVVGYQSIGEYVQEISERISKPVDHDEDLEHVPEEDKKAYKRSDIRLLIASSIVSEIRSAVKEKTGYECSAGIAHNKVLAKLVCGLNKPNKQTIIPLKHIAQLFSTLPVRKIQGLGGKFGEKVCEDLNIQFMGELTKFSKEELQKRYDEKNGLWLFNISRGIDLEVVTPRLVSKSIGCCKKFPGRNAITAVTTLKHWLHELVKEITDRLEQDEVENNRRPKQMVVSFIQSIDNKDVSSSRTVNLTTIDEEKLVNDALDVLKRNTEKFFKSVDNISVLNNPIKFLGLNVGKFESLEMKKGNTIQDMFQRNIENKNGEPKEIEESEKSENITTTGNRTDNATSITHAKYDESTKITSTNKLSFFATYNKARLTNEIVTIDKLEQNIEKSEKTELNNENLIDEENTFQNELLIEELASNDQSIFETNSKPLVPLTSTKPSYLETYAEFYRPDMQLELPKIECQQCGEKIYESNMQIHMDSHLAFQLTQQQRQEFRNELKRTISTAPPPSAKKTKKATKSRELSNEKSIQKFLIRPSQLNQSTNHTDNEQNIQTEECEECSKNIPIDKLFEHKDFHAAKRLHDELMQLERESRFFQNNDGKRTVKSAVKNAKSNKRKLPKSSSANNIASFFRSA